MRRFFSPSDNNDPDDARAAAIFSSTQINSPDQIAFAAGAGARPSYMIMKNLIELSIGHNRTINPGFSVEINNMY